MSFSVSYFEASSFYSCVISAIFAFGHEESDVRYINKLFLVVDMRTWKTTNHIQERQE